MKITSLTIPVFFPEILLNLKIEKYITHTRSKIFLTNLSFVSDFLTMVMTNNGAVYQQGLNALSHNIRNFLSLEPHPSNMYINNIYTQIQQWSNKKDESTSEPQSRYDYFNLYKFIVYLHRLHFLEQHQ